LRLFNPFCSTVAPALGLLAAEKIAFTIFEVANGVGKVYLIGKVEELRAAFYVLRLTSPRH
jgi:hypothetical protein